MLSVLTAMKIPKMLSVQELNQHNKSSQNAFVSVPTKHSRQSEQQNTDFSSFLLLLLCCLGELGTARMRVLDLENYLTELAKMAKKKAADDV